MIHGCCFRQPRKYVQTRKLIYECGGGATDKALQKEVDWPLDLPIIYRKWVYVYHPLQNACAEIVERDACRLPWVNGVGMSPGALRAPWYGQLATGLQNLAFNYGLEPRLPNWTIFDVHTELNSHLLELV
ncbi:hypothetical protein WI95_03875 [Burkholderia contaminans]|nr:hypothetical protein WI95_03875 [Burkholderia contaminans]